MKIKATLLIILAGMTALALTACGGSGGAALDGTAWTLTDLNGSVPIAGTTLTVKFADGQVSGSAGCNSYGGTYEINGDRLTVSALFMTEMACLEPAGAMDQEFVYLDVLGSAASYKVDGAQLQITSDGGNTLTFAASGE